MRLSELLGAKGAANDTEIGGLTADSREVMPGWLFAALPGSQTDGRRYIGEALDRGAVALLVPAGGEQTYPETVIVIEAAQPRRRYAQLAARFYGRQPETAVAVTGTNGKTSVVRFLRQIWKANGLAGASLGTLGLESDAVTAEGRLTTPDPAYLHQLLADLADAGVDHIAFEASSHGLDQGRLDGVRLTAGGFTHITQDHLDYHGTMEAYFYAKARLFGELIPPGGTAVINVDTPGGRSMEDLAWGRGLKLITVGREADCDLSISDVAPTRAGQQFTARWQSTEMAVHLPLIGRFQADNALLAAGLAIAAGLEPHRALSALETLHGVPGRMELVGSSATGAPVFVDYAHTEGGLETVLTAARPHISGKLWVVFGCGGDRDRAKRPAMGRTAASLADQVIITDDNPRSEDPAAIRAAIREGCPDARVIADRALAIQTAIDGLGASDGLIIAGKGHETGQIVGDTVLPFNDRDVAAARLARPAETPSP